MSVTDTFNTIDLYEGKDLNLVLRNVSVLKLMHTKYGDNLSGSGLGILSF